MLSGNIDSIILIIISAWFVYICWKVFIAGYLICFLMFGLSIVLLFLSVLMPNAVKYILQIISEILFFVAILWGLTIERNKFIKFRESTTIKDILLGRFSNKK